MLWGDYLEGSDWDVVVVSDKFAGILFLERATSALKKLPIRRVDLLCYTKEEFNQKAEEIEVVSDAIKGKRLI